MSLNTFYPTFLTEVRGYSLAESSQIVSISTVLFPISAIFFGWLCDKIHSRKLVTSFPFIMFGIIVFLPFRVTGWQIYVIVALQGLIGAAVPVASFAGVGEIMRKPQWISLGLGIFGIAQNMATLIGPILFGHLVKSLGWISAGLWLLPFCIAGYIAICFIRMK